MADLMGVMLKSLGVNPTELMKTAGDVQEMVSGIHAMLTTIIRQQELIIVHFSEFANKGSPLYMEGERLLTRMVEDGTLSVDIARCSSNNIGDSCSGD